MRPAPPYQTRRGAGRPSLPPSQGRCAHRPLPPRSKELGTVAGFKHKKEPVCFFISVEPTLITRNRCSRAETTCCPVLVKYISSNSFLSIKYSVCVGNINKLLSICLMLF